MGYWISFLNTNCSDQPLPEIEYTEEEHKTWKIVFSKLKSLYETYACAEYRHNLADLENTGLFVPDRIPNLREVNNYLQSNFQLNNRIFFWIANFHMNNHLLIEIEKFGLFIKFLLFNKIAKHIL